MALSAPYRACTALPDKNTVYAVTTQNRGLLRMCIGILKSGKAVLVSSPISNRDIIAGCRLENSGYVTTCGYALQGYISNRTFKR